MELHELSADYWVIDLEIIPWSGDHAVMDERDHRILAETVYGCCGDHPLLVKYGDEGTHVPVYPEPSVPGATIAVPNSDGFGRKQAEVLIAKAAFAERLLS